MTNSVVLSSENQAIINSDVTKIFLGKNRSKTGTYTNSTGATVTLLAGTVLARIASTNKLIPLDSSLTNGGQFPVGVLMHDVTVLNAASADLTFCVAGDVAVEQLILLGYGDSINTVVSSRTIRDRIGSDTVGIYLVEGTTDLTAYDNQ